MTLVAVVKEHAVLRYLERFRPGQSYEAAQSSLQGMVQRAKRLATSPHNGGEYWMLDEAAGVVGVVADEPGGRYLVTVVRADKMGTDTLAYRGGRVAKPSLRRPKREGRKQRLNSKARRERAYAGDEE